jgi:hypothetical protein
MLAAQPRQLADPSHHVRLKPALHLDGLHLHVILEGRLCLNRKGQELHQVDLVRLRVLVEA